MKNKPLNFLGNIFIILIALIVVLYFSLKDNYHEIINAMTKLHPIWILLGTLFLVIYRIFASVAHYFVIKQNKEHISFLKCLQINFIILFFHGVTPFAGGGQPMEIYYLHKEGIAIPKATNITLQNFIVYQVALVLTGIIALIYNRFLHIFPHNHLINHLVIVGFIINLLVLVVTYILSFGKKVNQFILEKGIRFLAKIKILKDEENVKKKLQIYLTNFHQNAIELKKAKSLVGLYVLFDFLGLCALYSIPYFISLGLGCKITLINTIIATAYVMIIGSFVPIPGGTGGIEYGFVFFFRYFIKGSLLNALMLLWRFISYYLGMIIGAITLAFYRKKEKKCE